MRLAGVLLCLLLIAGCSAPRVETFDDSRLNERIDQLSQANQELRNDLAALRARLDSDTAALNSQLTTLQDAYSKIWDSYNSIVDFVLAQYSGATLPQPENLEGGE